MVYFTILPISELKETAPLTQLSPVSREESQALRCRTDSSGILKYPAASNIFKNFTHTASGKTHKSTSADRAAPAHTAGSVLKDPAQIRTAEGRMSRT